MTTTDVDSTEDTYCSLGVFQLKNQVEKPSALNNGPAPTRQGASFVSETTSDSEAMVSEADDFPMIVWLRGDEPWFTQFDMDAEATMATLGIKRSRLTQIAGRDLRVGRVRVDRYIRPVFRSIDVTAYLNQTRATASHQKSSEAIHAASQAFNEQIGRFQNTLEAISSNLTAQLNSVLGTLISESMSHNMAPIHGRVDSLEADIVNRISVVMQDTVLKHVDSLKSQLSESERVRSASFDLLLKNLEATSAQLHSLANMTREKLNDVGGTVSLLRTDVQALEISMEHEIKATQNDITELRDTILSDKDNKTEQLQQKASLAWRSSPRRRRMRPS